MSELLQPGQIIRPLIESDEIPALVKRLFGLTVKSFKELKSYDDKNYLIQVTEEYENSGIEELWPYGYVLKITNGLDTKDGLLIDGQNQMMQFLGTRGFNVPQPVRNTYGTFMTKEKFLPRKDAFIENNVCCEPDAEYMARLLTFIPGKTLYEVPYTPQLFFECGAYIATMDNELKGFKNEAISKRKLIWLLSSVPELSKFVYAVKDENDRTIIHEILETWNTKVIPLLPKLERGIIHGDCNEQNILVKPDLEDVGKYHVSGLVDFGDVSENCYVFELAITITYMMIEVRVMPPNESGGHVLAGYLKHRKLTSEEWDILKECVAARFAQSLVLGAYSYDQDPGNEYLIITAARGWDILKEFWKTPKDAIFHRWRQIIHTYS